MSLWRDGIRYQTLTSGNTMNATVKNGFSDFGNLQIVVAENASKVEVFAANELGRYLRKMTGTDTPVVHFAAQSKANIIVGDTGWELLRDGRVVKSRLKHDGFVIHHDGNRLLVIGNNPRGTLNGVYTLLHEWGCRWFFPREAEEIVPRLTELPFVAGTRVVNPDLELRGACLFPVERDHVEDLRAIIDWMGKNRLNILMTSVHRTEKRVTGWKVEWMNVSDELLPEIERRGIILDMSEHAGRHFFPTSYFEKHPEWFALNAQGQRFSTGQICYSNEEAVNVLADNYANYAKAHPEVSIIGTWPEDGYGFCQCDKCKRPGVVLKAINRVAEKIEAVRPDITVEYLSYTKETCDVPAEILPRSNLSILVANTRVAKEWLAKSEAVGGKGVCRLHYHIADNSAERANLPLRFEQTKTDCAATIEAGLRGIIPFYIGIDTWWRSSLNLYIMSACAWNRQWDVKEILGDFCKTYYADSSGETVSIFESLEKIPRVNQSLPPPWPLWQDWPNIKTDYAGSRMKEVNTEFRRLRKMLADYRTKSGGSPVLSKRYDAMEAFIDYAETMFKAWNARALAVMAFERNDVNEVRRGIVEAAKQEQRLIDLINRSRERDDGVNGAWPDFSFFQNWRFQLDKQLLEMRTSEQKKPVTDENPDVEMFLPGLLGL